VSWPKPQLQEFCRIIQGGRSGLSGNDFVPEGIPAYGAGGLNGYLPTHEFDESAVILSSIGARCGKCFYADGKWASLANTQLIFPDTTKADVRFLWIQLNDESRWHRSGTGQPFIKPSDVKAHRVLLPPLAEQRRIAEVLDRAEALRAKRRAALAQLDSLTQSLFLDLFGDPVTNSKAWKRFEMTEAVVGKYGIKAGPFGSSLKKEDYAESGYRIYGQEQVIAGRFDIGDYYIGERKYQQLKSCAVAEGDLLVSLVGSFGKVLVVPAGIEPGIINPRLLKITPNQTLVTPGFLASLLQHPTVQAEFQRVAHGGTMGILNAGLLKQLKVILPPIPLQREFARRVTAVEALKTAQRASLAELDALFATLQHRAFRGEL
jgi:type I restriction enzyme S subunit